MLRSGDLHPLTPPSNPSVRGYARFVSLAGWLQVHVGPSLNILLPTRKVGDALGVSRQTVSTLRNWASRDRLIVEVRGHKYGLDKGSGQFVQEATEFRFDISRYPELSSVD